ELRPWLLARLASARPRHPAGWKRPQGRRAEAALEQRSLAQDGARADFGDRLAIGLDRQHAVEQEEQLFARLPLLDQRLAGGELAELGPGAAPHDLLRELTFESGLNLRDEGGRIVASPGRPFAEDV